jgi:hypothetical protein
MQVDDFGTIISIFRSWARTVLLLRVPHRPCGQTEDTQLAVIMPTSTAPRRALTGLTKRKDMQQNSAFVIQIAF